MLGIYFVHNIGKWKIVFFNILFFVYCSYSNFVGSNDSFNNYMWRYYFGKFYFIIFEWSFKQLNCYLTFFHSYLCIDELIYSQKIFDIVQNQFYHQSVLLKRNSLCQWYSINFGSKVCKVTSIELYWKFCPSAKRK